MQRDFGYASDAYRSAVTSLFRAFQDAKRSNPTRLLFLEWQAVFQQSVGIIGQEQVDPAPFLESDEIAPKLFVIHTYLSLLAKLLGALFLFRYMGRGDRPDPISVLMSQDARRWLEELESGTYFESFGLRDFTQGNYFDWYLSDKAWPLAENAVRRIAQELAAYDSPVPEPGTNAMIVMFRQLYENTIPQELRRALGEFNTPWFLAERVLERLDDGRLARGQARLVDPCCGIGTFLSCAILRMRGRPIDEVLRNVQGVDLNPFAVQAARVAYLWSLDQEQISELDPNNPREIPVYLADSIYLPSLELLNGEPTVSYCIPASGAEIRVRLPEAVVRRGDCFRSLCLLLRSAIEHRRTSAAVLDEAASLLARNGIRISGPAMEQIRDLYETLWRLHHDEGMDGIWALLLRNRLAPAFLGRFDFVVGNPPWVRWSKLPPSYRNIIRPICQSYHIFSDDYFVGGIESDISTVIVYVSAHRLLAPGGRISFLVNRSIWRNISSQGFRRFTLPDGRRLRLLEVVDWSACRPFGPDVHHNPTSFVAVEEGNGEPSVSVVPWYRVAEDGQRMEQLEARPVFFPGDPLVVARPGQTEDIVSVAARSCAWQARKGITTDLNSVYFVRVLGEQIEPDRCGSSTRLRVEPGARPGRRSVSASEQLWVDADFVFPTMFGEHIRSWVPRSSDIAVLLPQVAMSALPEPELRDRDPALFQYFSRHRDKLVSRSSYRRYLTSFPFYSCWNVGAYTFAPYKVAWSEQSKRFRVCILGAQALSEGSRVRKVVVPDHKVYFIPCWSLEDALFLAGWLNSRPVRSFVDAYSEELVHGAHNIDFLYLPARNDRDARHAEIVDAARTAWTAAEQIWHVVDGLSRRSGEHSRRQLRAAESAVDQAILGEGDLVQALEAAGVVGQEAAGLKSAVEDLLNALERIDQLVRDCVRMPFHG